MKPKDVVTEADKEKLCSNCGLCMVPDWSVDEALQSCVFQRGWLGSQEKDLFGRERSLEDPDEVCFGISKRRLAGSLRRPIEGSAWTGVITRMAQRAFESGLAEGVVTLHRGQAHWFAPEPVLARSTAQILAGAGNKPVVSPVLKSLGEAYRQGLRRVLVIGAGCHVHNLRDFKQRFDYLKDMEIYVVGIPCVSNVNLKNLQQVLEMFSESPATVRHYEFMQDYTVHLKHADGHIEKLPYFCIPREFTGINLVQPACLGCFDYLNGLADITVGYLAAPFDMKKMYQWLVVRTDRGQQLYDLIADELDTVPEGSAGDSSRSTKKAAQRAVDQLTPGSESERKTGRPMPLWAGRMLAALLQRLGPRGREYARYGVYMQLIRNYYYIKFYRPELLKTLVPAYMYRVLEDYDFEP